MCRWIGALGSGREVCKLADEHSEGKLIVLVSYTPVDAGGSDMAIDTGNHVKRVFSLVKLTYLGDTFRVDDVRVVPYQRVRVNQISCASDP